MLRRWLVAFAVLAGIGAAAWYGLPGTQPRPEPGQTAPDFRLPDLAGRIHGLPKDGSVVLLNFWATWCPPCRKELPSMAALHRRLAGEGLKIIAVSVDRDASSLTGFVRENRLPFMVLHDADSKVSHQYGVFRYPETFLIDRQGRIRRHVIGALDWMSPGIFRQIKGMLAEKSTG